MCNKYWRSLVCTQHVWLRISKVKVKACAHSKAISILRILTAASWCWQIIYIIITQLYICERKHIYRKKYIFSSHLMCIPFRGSVVHVISFLNMVFGFGHIPNIYIYMYVYIYILWSLSCCIKVMCDMYSKCVCLWQAIRRRWCLRSRSCVMFIRHFCWRNQGRAHCGAEPLLPWT